MEDVRNKTLRHDQSHTASRPVAPIQSRIHTLTKRLLDHLAANNQTLSIAESLTGGLVTAVLTDMPGASKVIKGSIVAYSNSCKSNVLGVPVSILETVGPVSMECAKHMAVGVKNVIGTTWGLSTTGWAGSNINDEPEGNTVMHNENHLPSNSREADHDESTGNHDEKSSERVSSDSISSSHEEDGRVFVFVTGPSGENINESLIGRRFQFQGNRWGNRWAAVECALELILSRVTRSTV